MKSGPWDITGSAASISSGHWQLIEGPAIGSPRKQYPVHRVQSCISSYKPFAEHPVVMVTLSLSGLAATFVHYC